MPWVVVGMKTAYGEGELIHQTSDIYWGKLKCLKKAYPEYNIGFFDYKSDEYVKEYFSPVKNSYGEAAPTTFIIDDGRVWYSKQKSHSYGSFYKVLTNFKDDEGKWNEISHVMAVSGSVPNKVTIFWEYAKKAVGKWKGWSKILKFCKNNGIKEMWIWDNFLAWYFKNGTPDKVMGKAVIFEILVPAALMILLTLYMMLKTCYSCMFGSPKVVKEEQKPKKTGLSRPD